MPKERPGWGKRNSNDPFGDHQQKKKKSDSEAELKTKVNKRKERIAKIMENEKKIANAKEILEKSANAIVESVAKRVKGKMKTETIYNFVVGEINKKVGDFEIDYSACREEIVADFRKYLKAQATAIYQRILQKTERI